MRRQLKYESYTIEKKISLLHPPFQEPERCTESTCLATLANPAAPFRVYKVKRCRSKLKNKELTPSQAQEL